MEHRPSIPRESTSAGSRWSTAAAFVAAAIAVDSVLALLACNGTTGRPDLVLPPTSLADANPDASLGDGGDAPASEGGEGGDEGGIYTGLFDVAIVYADRDLPDITPAPNADGGEGGGYPFPTNCPPYISVNNRHMPIPISFGTGDEVPTDPTSDGGSTFAADGSACLYPWFGTTAIDECTTSFYANQGMDNLFAAFPPCNWCPPGSGTVNQGPNPGEDRTLACWTLYDCMMKSQCYLMPTGVGACLCGSESIAQCQTDPHPSGPCASEELEAIETTNAQPALANFISLSAPNVSGTVGTGTCGSYLNGIFETAIGDLCFPPLGDP